MSDELEVRLVAGRSGPTLVVAGEIDRANADHFRAELEAAVRPDQALTVDLTSVTYLDSSGVAVLFDLLDAGVERLVAGEGCRIRRLLGIAGLEVEPPP